MKKICGRRKLDGTPCQRGPRCRLPHQRGQIATRASEIASTAIAGPVTFDAYPADTATDVLIPLRESDDGFFLQPDGVKETTIDAIVALLNDPELEGRTISPRMTATGELIEPDRGIAVALPGSDLRFEFETQPHQIHDSDIFDEDAPFEPLDNVVSLRRDIKTFLDFMQPVAETGTAWIGLWKDDGVIELNMTVLVEEEYLNDALWIGEQWDQKQVYHVSLRDCLDTFGSGGESIFSTMPNKPKKKRLNEPEGKWRSRLTDRGVRQLENLS